MASTVNVPSMDANVDACNKRPVWNVLPNGSVEISPVMGAVSWPALFEATKSFPKSSESLKSLSDGSSSAPARKFYESVLRLEPGFLGAALALAALHVIEGQNMDVVSLLERYIKDWLDDSLHIKLAQVFAATNMLSEALSHSLRINPQTEAAKRGLEHLKKQIKYEFVPLHGVDPDAPEDDEENKIEDAEGDQEKAELLYPQYCQFMLLLCIITAGSLR